MENIDYQKVFTPILDEGERVLGGFKPNRKRLIGGCLFWCIGGLLFYGGFIAVWLATTPSDPEVSEFIRFLVAGIAAGLYVVFAVVMIVVFALLYKHSFYAYTDRRILIRTGIIGVDYRTLDYDFLAAMDVKVGFLDKLLRTNTGSITFGSASSPIVASGAQGGSPFVFSCIDDPYNNLKIIKKAVNEGKDGR